MHTRLLFIILTLALAVTPRLAARADGGTTAADSAKGPPPAFSAGLSLPGESESGAIYEMGVSMGFGFEYNDNIDEQADNKMTDTITHLRPAFSFRRLGGRFRADVEYRGDYLFYTQAKDTEEYRHYLNALVAGELIENLFSLSVKENMQQVYRDVSRGEASIDETGNDLVNKNRFTVSPAFTLRPSERTNLAFGYDFADVRYGNNRENQSRRPISFNSGQYDFNYRKSQNHTLYLHLDHELTDKVVLFTGGDILRWIDNDDENETDQSFTRYTVYAGGSWELAENLKASVKAGPAVSNPDEHPSKTRPFIEADITYTLGRSIFSAFHMTTYEDNAGTGGSTRRAETGVRWDKEFDRSHLTASFSYNKYEDEVESGTTRGRDKKDTYRPYVRYTYDLSDRLSSFISYYALIYENHAQGSHRHYGTYGLRYELSPNSNITVSHQIRYVDAYEDDSFFINRVMVDFVYTF